MENASKALLMAAGVLLGLMILVVAGFLFTSLGAFHKMLIMTELHNKQQNLILTSSNLRAQKK